MTLGRADVESIHAGVAHLRGLLDLLSWRRVALQPRSTLQRENNDWVQFIGPFSRDVLEQALHALPRHQRVSLRRQVAELDVRFLEKALNNPSVDPSLPWWWRRI